MLGEDYYPVYALEQLYRQVSIEVRQPTPEPSIPFITVHEATPKQKHTAQYDEEGHLRRLLNQAWGDGAISGFTIMLVVIGQCSSTAACKLSKSIHPVSWWVLLRKWRDKRKQMPNLSKRTMQNGAD